VSVDDEESAIEEQNTEFDKAVGRSEYAEEGVFELDVVSTPVSEGRNSFLTRLAVTIVQSAASTADLVASSVVETGTAAYPSVFVWMPKNIIDARPHTMIKAGIVSQSSI
jgi:hypothetical protein